MSIHQWVCQRGVMIGVTILIGMGWTSTVVADNVTFTNGDQLSGTILKLRDGTLIVDTNVAGEVETDFADVQTFSVAEPIEVHLQDGSILKGYVTSDETARRVMVHPSGLPPVPLELSTVVAIGASQWTGSLRGGFSFTEGNSSTQAFNAGVNLRRRTRLDRLTLRGEYLFGRQEDPDTGESSTTQNEWLGSLQYDYFVTDRLYVYGGFRIERDKIADLDLRLISGVGMGYQWIERSDFNVSTEAGLAWLYESFENGDSEDEVSLRLAYHIDKLVPLYTDIELFHDLELYPALTDPSDFFLTTQFGARTKLIKNVFAEAKLVIKHDTSPAPESKKTDYNAIFGVGVTF